MTLPPPRATASASVGALSLLSRDGKNRDLLQQQKHESGGDGYDSEDAKIIRLGAGSGPLSSSIPSKAFELRPTGAKSVGASMSLSELKVEVAIGFPPEEQLVARPDQLPGELDRKICVALEKRLPSAALGSPGGLMSTTTLLIIILVIILLGGGFYGRGRWY